MSTAKENILKKISKALSNSVPLPFANNNTNNAIFAGPTDELAVIFATEFTALQGKFVYCQNEKNAIEQIHALIAAKEWAKVFCSIQKWNPHFSNTIGLASCDVSITSCESLVARTGSVVLSAAEIDGRTASVYAPIHICIAYTNQLVFDIKDALELISTKYNNNIPSFITFATGPSRTADIEKTLVTGVHGPKEVFLFLIEAGQYIS
jgi:L-lactate dehydrogenase complex protein LldG